MSFFARHPWWGVIPLILIAFLLGSPRLDSEGLWYDEMYSVYVAGGAHLGPLTPEGILQRVLWEDSTQGYGYPLLLGGWGALMGWSEYSIRVLAMFGGLLAIAMAYRLGHDVIKWGDRIKTWRPPAYDADHSAIWVGLASAMILAVSAFFVWYLHEGRVYSIVVFLGLTTVWSYLRLLNVSKASVPLMALFALSAAGLLYANYFAVVLLVGIAFYHLLINPYLPILTHEKTSQAWWRLVFLAVCAALLCIPTLFGIRGGYSMYAGWDDVRNRALSLPELARVMAHFTSHDAFLLLAILLLVGLWWGWHQSQGLRGLLLITLISLITIFIIQWRTQIIEFTKFRYVIVLWGLFAIWIAAGMVGLGAILVQALHSILTLNTITRAKTWRLGLLVTGLVALVWLAGGVNANIDPYFMTENGPAGDLPRWRTVVNLLKGQALPQDVYAHYSGPRARDDDMSFWFTMHEISIPSFITISAFDVENEDWAWAQVERAWRVWYSQDLRQPVTDDHTRFVARMTDMGYVPCTTPYADAVMRVDLYVDSPAFCPGGEAVVRFGEGATLTGWQEPPTEVTSADTLIFPMGWTIDPTLQADLYSIGLYLMSDATTVAAQADTGLPETAFGLARLELSLTNVAPGTYDLYMAVYEWNGPNALPATHLRTGETSPRLIKMATIEVKGN